MRLEKMGVKGTHGWGHRFTSLLTLHKDVTADSSQKRLGVVAGLQAVRRAVAIATARVGQNIRRKLFAYARLLCIIVVICVRFLPCLTLLRISKVSIFHNVRHP